jgi:hypothetical protein
MKPISAIFMLFLMAGVFVNQGHAANIKPIPKLEGFGEFKWGMSLTDALKTKSLECREKDDKGINFCFDIPIKTEKGDFQYLRTDVGGANMSVSYDFKNRKLVRVSMNGTEKVDRDLMLKNITNKYGKPHRTYDVADKIPMKITEWRVYDSIITLEDWRLEGVVMFWVKLNAPANVSLGF